MSTRRTRRALPCALACLLPLAGFAQTQSIEVLGHYENAVGTSDAASQGSVTQRLIANRPALRPGEILEFVPGMIVTQHSGDGKANQYFLRGFNLDHGTDFATYVDGIPANMVSHAHGQGYTDLNFLIPELVRRIDYTKGPYFAREGNFSSAGSARLSLVDRLPQNLAELRVGENGFARGLFAGSVAVGGGNLIGAFEAQVNDGPWEVSEDLRKFNGLLRWAQASGDVERSVTLMAYDSRWTATDQVPAALVDAGTLDRFGSLDASDAGRAKRLSLSAMQRTTLADGEWQASVYALQSRLNLWSNFTYFLDDEVNGDQFEQAERRRMAGGELWRRFDADWGGRPQSLTVGAQLRHDRLDPVGLYLTTERRRRETTRENEVRETSAGLYADWGSRWTPWLRSVAGLRADSARFEVDGDTASSHLYSPKLSLVFGPFSNTELFVNAGRGMHSNDARGTTDAAQPVPGLVASKGYEVGARTEWLPGLQTSLAVWRLELDSELVYIGDAGNTEPNRASKRDGIELNNHWVLDGLGLKGWLVDLDLAASKARFRSDEEGVGTRVPGAVDRVASFGLTYAPAGGPFFGQFQLRHFGPRDLVEDGSQRSASTTLAYLRAGWRPLPDFSLSLDVFNLFDKQASDIDYFYESRPVAGGAAAEDRHFHPVEPRTFRVTASWRF